MKAYKNYVKIVMPHLTDLDEFKYLYKYEMYFCNQDAVIIKTNKNVKKVFNDISILSKTHPDIQIMLIIARLVSYYVKPEYVYEYRAIANDSVLYTVSDVDDETIINLGIFECNGNIKAFGKVKN